MYKLENLSADWMKCGRPANRYEQHAVTGYSKFAVLNFLLSVTVYGRRRNLRWERH